MFISSVGEHFRLARQLKDGCRSRWYHPCFGRRRGLMESCASLRRGKLYSRWRGQRSMTLWRPLCCHASYDTTHIPPSKVGIRVRKAVAHFLCGNTSGLYVACYCGAQDHLGAQPESVHARPQAGKGPGVGVERGGLRLHQVAMPQEVSPDYLMLCSFLSFFRVFFFSFFSFDQATLEWRPN